MRVYVPATVPGLQALRDNGFGAPVAAHAVTPALREWYIEGDLDELEYAASSRAAEASLRLLAGDRSGRAAGTARRVVVAAEVPDAMVRAVPDGRSEVVLNGALVLGQVVSLHVDGDEALADVAAAVDAVSAADGGDQDARFTVDAAAGHELLWYDVTELDDVLGMG